MLEYSTFENEYRVSRIIPLFVIRILQKKIVTMLIQKMTKVLRQIPYQNLTMERIHTTDGYDGVHQFDDSFVRLWRGFEDQNNAVGLEEISFEYQYARTDEDGYRERNDILTAKGELNITDDENANFPGYDQTGWDRTHMADYLSGKCVGTYFGGEYGCSYNRITL